MSAVSEHRADQLRANLAGVRERIARATADAGRPPGEVSLVVVTKFFPASDVRLLAGLGVADVGENRHQEAEAKAAECADLRLRWHFIGGLRTDFLSRHPDATVLSAGMSGDLEAAITVGATHVRVGSAVLGSRVGVQ